MDNNICCLCKIIVYLWVVIQTNNIFDTYIRNPTTDPTIDPTTDPTTLLNRYIIFIPQVSKQNVINVYRNVL